jgi:orotidine-5'-phosphate decarboxylase
MNIATPVCRSDNQKKPGHTALIVALDTDSLRKAAALVDMLYPEVKIFKVGSQLFTQAGPAAVNMLREKGARVFLDLKFHDIPNTVASAVKAACRMRVFIINLHASGGAEMMKAAVMARGKSTAPVLLAVTMLTSIGGQGMRAIGIQRSPVAQVRRLALLAKDCGMDGVVCSGHEIGAIRRACGSEFIVLTPGIRPADAGGYDQKRIMTPALAARKGADYIVVGRPVTKARRPLTVARSILKGINSIF